MDGKELQEFDDFVKGALENIQVPYDASSWDAMQAKLAKAQPADVDKIARDALAQYRVPYQAASWQMLLDRLERIEYKRRLVALKILEVAVVLLLLVSIGRFTSPLIHQHTDPKIQEENTTPTEQNLKEDQSPVEMAEVQQPERDVEEESRLAQYTEKTKLPTSEHTSHLSSDLALTPKPPVKDHVQELDLGNSGVTRHHAGLKVASELEDTENSRLGTDDLELESTAVARVTEGIPHALDADTRAHLAANLLSARAGEVSYDRQDPIQTVALDKLTESAVALAPIEIAKQALTTRIGIYSQVTRHWGESNIPASRDVHQQRFDDVGAGFMANVQFGRIGFDMGMGYEKIIFTSPQKLNFAPNEAHKVHLPVHLRVNALQKEGFRVYAKAGVAAHGVLYANYDETSIFARGNSSTSQAEADRFNDGLLHQGLRTNNFYLMKSAGVGIDGRISQDLSIFLEGNYQDNFSGSIGSLSNGAQLRMETVSILLGVFYKFD